MASENPSLRSSLSNALQSQTGKAYEVVYVPEDGWLKVRQDFIRNNNLGRMNQSDDKQSITEHEEKRSSFVQEANKKI